MGARTLQALAYKILRPKTGFVVWGTLSEHSEREWGQIRQGLRRIILRYADAVLVNGRSGARYVKQFGVRAERIFIVNQPVDVEAFRNSAIRPDADMIRLLFVGTLTRRKGLHLFIENLAEWSLSHQGRKIHIDWVGEGDLAPILQRYQYGPDISQTFHGALPYVAMPEVFAKADILIFPSLLDEWGLVVNEAMASGLPIVGSIFSEAVEELVTDDETGWTFDPTSAKSTLHALNRALTAPRDQLARMSRAAERRIETLTPSNAAEIIATAAKQARACGTVPMP
jgi:glycosyltransferase involved in cell wall biosynthesis